MYDYDRRVFVRSLKRTGRIAERNYLRTEPRRAAYVVTFPDGTDYLTGSADLRPADYICDGCGAWRSGSPHASGDDGEYAGAMQFCWLCAGPPMERETWRLERRELESLAALDQEPR
jgi:hypothetical protein